MISKKVKALCLLIVSVNAIVFPNITYASTYSYDFIYGDSDGNGIISANDAATILQKALADGYNMPIEKKTDNYLKYVDVDCDNKITANDAAEVLQKALLSTFVLPVEFSSPQNAKMLSAVWAPKNIANWTIKPYEGQTEQKFILNLYKDNCLFKTYNLTRNIDSLRSWDFVSETFDFSEDMREDEKALYTYDVTEVSEEGEVCEDTKKIVDLKYLYQDPTIYETDFILISRDNLVQVVTTLPGASQYKKCVEFDKDYLALESEGYIAEPMVEGIAGNACGTITNCTPIKSGKAKIICNLVVEETNETEYSKVMTINIDENMNVTLIKDNQDG